MGGPKHGKQGETQKGKDQGGSGSPIHGIPLFFRKKFCTAEGHGQSVN
jgi:hypothetical protein